MTKIAYDLCYLAACAVHGMVPAKEKIEGMDLDRLHEVSKMHSLSALVGMTLEGAGIPLTPAWREEKDKAIRKAILFDAERAKILRFLEENQIWHLPMKGVVLKDLYPKLGMREMADNDILYDPARQTDVAAFMKANGYEAKSIGKSHHDTYYKAPIYNFEMHTMMFAEVVDARFTAYYENIKERLLPVEGKQYACRMGDDDFYIHMTAHEYKHYSRGGTGLRSLLDRYVYLQKKSESLHFAYIRTECARLGIDSFEEESRILCEKVFAGQGVPELTEAEQEMLEYYLFSTTYGTMSQSIRHRMEKEYGKVDASAKIRYILRRAFPKAEFYRAYYPPAYKYRILIPFVWFHRIVKAVFRKRRLIRREIRMVQGMEEGK